MAKKISYTTKTVDELTKLLDEKRETLRALRFSSAGSRAKDTNEASKLRKDIARIMTALTVHHAA